MEVEVQAASTVLVVVCQVVEDREVRHRGSLAGSVSNEMRKVRKRDGRQRVLAIKVRRRKNTGSQQREIDEATSSKKDSPMKDLRDIGRLASSSQ